MGVRGTGRVVDIPPPDTQKELPPGGEKQWELSLCIVGLNGQTQWSASLFDRDVLHEGPDSPGNPLMEDND